MRAFLQFIVRSASALTASGTVWLLSFFAFGQAFLFASLYGLIGGVGTYYTVKYISTHRYAKNNGLTMKEYKFISDNLKDASLKIKRLQRALINVRQLGNARENREILMTVRRIQVNTKNEPRRFFQVEGFYYKHLDSLVEIAEKYAYLSQQPVKSREMNEMMRDSRHAIIVLGQTVKKDLRVMLNDDVNTLDFELDVAKRTLQKPRNQTGG
ncbi:5-bromo-4-chloroindolyl phosphate hydrolysis family protein [Oceanobacillus sp. CAU 1775]